MKYPVPKHLEGLDGSSLIDNDEIYQKIRLKSCESYCLENMKEKLERYYNKLCELKSKSNPSIIDKVELDLTEKAFNNSLYHFLSLLA
jgi:hypothetical protein